MAIAEEQVLQIARLARLRLRPDEVGRMTEQLNTILAHVAVVAEADGEWDAEATAAAVAERDAEAATAAEAEAEAAAEEEPGTASEAAAERKPETDEAAAPTAGPEHGSAPLRSDVTAPDRLERSPAQLAPAWQDGFFTVPRLAALEPVGPGAPVAKEGERRSGAARSAMGESDA